MILHIATQQDWENAKINNEYTASTLDTDGFIHCSTLKQTVDTAKLFFKGQTGLVLLCLDEEKLTSECKYENPAGKHDSRIDNLFPHIYGPINISAVIKVFDFPPNAKGLFELPEELKNG